MHWLWYVPFIPQWTCLLYVFLKIYRHRSSHFVHRLQEIITYSRPIRNFVTFILVSNDIGVSLNILARNTVKFLEDIRTGGISSTEAKINVMIMEFFIVDIKSPEYVWLDYGILLSLSWRSYRKLWIQSRCQRNLFIVFRVDFFVGWRLGFGICYLRRWLAVAKVRKREVKSSVYDMMNLQSTSINLHHFDIRYSKYEHTEIWKRSKTKNLRSSPILAHFSLSLSLWKKCSRAHGITHF